MALSPAARTPDHGYGLDADLLGGGWRVFNNAPRWWGNEHENGFIRSAACCAGNVV